MTTFTPEETELLIEALDAWAKQPKADGISSALIGAMLGGGSQDDKKRELDKATSKMKADTKARERRTILLKAKLIMAAEAAELESVIG